MANELQLTVGTINSPKICRRSNTSRDACAVSSARGDLLALRVSSMSFDKKKHAHYTITLHNISEAIIASGFTSLNEQAKALGIHRATAWTIIKRKHKLGRLNRDTVARILSNPTTPHSVRTVVKQDVAERVDGSKRSNMR